MDLATHSDYAAVRYIGAIHTAGSANILDTVWDQLMVYMVRPGMFFPSERGYWTRRAVMFTPDVLTEVTMDEF